MGWGRPRSRPPTQEPGLQPRRAPARFRIEVDSFLTELDAAAAHAGELATMEEQISLDEEVRTRFSS